MFGKERKREREKEREREREMKGAIKIIFKFDNIFKCKTIWVIINHINNSLLVGYINYFLVSLVRLWTRNKSLRVSVVPSKVQTGT